jgi:hypothetical protein
MNPEPNMSAIDWDVLVLSPTPTWPLDFGNRKRIDAVRTHLRGRGARPHLLLYPAEMDWRGQLPLASWRKMSEQWESVHIAPATRPLHSPPEGLDHTIDEWWDPAIGDHLAWLFAHKWFDAFIVNYTYLSKGLEYAPRGVFKILDTHDRFADRRQLLESHGIAPEFFHTTRDEEAKAVARADLVWAIKPQEADYLRSLGNVPVTTLLHFEPWRPIERRPTPDDDGYLTIGLLGARNSINATTTRYFLDVAIPHFRRNFASIKIRIAGSMSLDLEDRAKLPEVEIVGRLERVEDFYASIDAVVIPMTFSTGLKIKTAEAIGAGAAIVAHAHAFEGFCPAHPYHELQELGDVAEACVALSFDREQLEVLRRASRRCQEALQEDTRRAWETTVAMRGATHPALLFTLPKSVLLPGSLAREHAIQASEYLRHRLPVVYYCDFSVSESDCRSLSERLGVHGRIYARSIRAGGDGTTPESVSECAGVSAASLLSLLSRCHFAAVWLAGLNDSGWTEEEADRILRIPVYAEGDLLAVESDSGRPMERDWWTQALARADNVTVVSTDPKTAARIASQLPRASTACVPVCVSRPPAVWADWAWQDTSSPWMLVLVPSATCAKATATLELLRLALPDGFGVRVVSCAAPAETGPQRFETLRLHEIYRDLRLLGGRPRFVLDLAEGCDAAGPLIEQLRRAGLPTLASGGGSGVGSRRDSALPNGRRMALMSLFDLVGRLTTDSAFHAALQQQARDAQGREFGREAGWSNVQTTLADARAAARVLCG